MTVKSWSWKSDSAGSINFVNLDSSSGMTDQPVVKPLRGPREVRVTGYRTSIDKKYCD